MFLCHLCGCSVYELGGAKYLWERFSSLVDFLFSFLYCLTFSFCAYVLNTNYLSRKTKLNFLRSNVIYYVRYIDQAWANKDLFS